MRKPDGYDEAKSSSYKSKKLPAGAYEVEILNAAVREEYGIEKLILQIDIASGDYKGYFKSNYDYQFKNPRKGQTAKWKGIFRQGTSGKYLDYFKSLIKIIEDSNDGYKFDFDEKTLKSKKLGMIFKDKSFFNDDGDEIHYIAADTPLTLDDLYAGNYDFPTSKPADQSLKQTPKKSTADEMVDDDKELEIPF